MKKIFFSILLISFISQPHIQISAAELSADDLLDLPLDALLSMSVTSVSRKEQKLSSAAAAIYVITNEDIKRSGVTTIADALQMAPGIQVAKIDSNKWAVSSRGNNGRFANKLLVQIDGRSIYSSTFSGVYWDVQDTLLEDIDRIEVIRGPGATLWGTNAVNGIINIITKKASDTTGTFISVGVGDYEKNFAHARMGRVFSERLAGRAYVKYQNKDNYTFLDSQTEEKGDAGDQWKSISTGFRFDGDFSSEDTWTLQGDLYKNHENQNIYLLGDSFSQLVKKEKDNFEASGWNVLGRWNRQVDKQTSMSLQMYFDHSRRDEIYLGQKHNVFDIDFQYQSNYAEHHNIIWGAAYRYLEDDFGSGYIRVDPSQKQSNLFSAFIQDEIVLVPGIWLLTIGTKLEHNKNTHFEFQPNIRLAWLLNKNQTLWSSISRAIRTPSRFERGGKTIAAYNSINGSPIIFSLIGNEEFDSEKLISYELGYRNTLTANTSIDLTLFYNESSNLLFLDQTSGDGFIPSFEVENKLLSETYGAELAADWRFKPWWRWQSSYSFAKNTGGNDFNSSAGSLPRHQLSLRSLMEITENVQLDLWAVYIDELIGASNQAITSNIVIDPYTRLNIRLAWKLIKDLELSLIGQNLLEEKHLEFTGETYVQPTEVGRSIYAQLNWEMD